MYEPFIDYAKSYSDLKKRLIAQGYKNLAEGEILMLNLGANIPKANTTGYKVKKSMIRKKKI